MSYLDFPRIHFTGGFQAAPSTVNNAPANYERALAPNVQPWDMDTWWNAYGNAFFTLQECTVSAVQCNPGTSSDALVGQQVFAAYTSSPPKIADLDPMQQNVSEWWGLSVQVGLGGSAGRLLGNFAPIAFNNIWGPADGAKFGSGAGAGVYQSSLTDVSIDPGSSVALARLQQCLLRENRLSIRIQLRAYNTNDLSYDLTKENLARLRKTALAQLPEDVWANLQIVSAYRQGLPAKTPPGVILATLFLNHLMQRWLGERAANEWGAAIRTATQLPYKSPVSTAFTYGKLIGSIGPAAPGEPAFCTGKRMLAPAQSASTNFAPFQLEDDVLSIDLSNALSTQNPVDGPFQDYGTLAVGYGDGSLISDCTLQYSDFAASLSTGAIVDVKLSPADAAKAGKTAISVYSIPTGSTKALPILVEDAAGRWMRADQFVFRMSPGMKVTEPHCHGDTAEVTVVVRALGVPPPDGTVTVRMTMLDPKQSLDYTNSTVGTAGTPGLDLAPMATPAEALTFNATAPVKGGVATFQLTARSPGNPRKFIDGQIYFLRYAFEPPVAGYQQGADDLVSVLVFDHVTHASPTWDNCIGKILTQYGRLYPIMWRFGLDSHESVKANAKQIAVVFERAMADPFHMPVTRDLSPSRRALILEWMKNGMP